MEPKGLEDLAWLAKNDKHLKGVYLDFEKFMDEKYTAEIKNNIESIQDKKQLHEFITMFALVTWISATLNKMK